MLSYQLPGNIYFFKWVNPLFGRKSGARFSFQVLAPGEFKAFFIYCARLRAFHGSRLPRTPVNFKHCVQQVSS